LAEHEKTLKIIATTYTTMFPLAQCMRVRVCMGFCPIQIKIDKPQKRMQLIIVNIIRPWLILRN